MFQVTYSDLLQQEVYTYQERDLVDLRLTLGMNLNNSRAIFTVLGHELPYSNLVRVVVRYNDFDLFSGQVVESEDYYDPDYTTYTAAIVAPDTLETLTQEIRLKAAETWSFTGRAVYEAILATTATGNRPPINSLELQNQMLQRLEEPTLDYISIVPILIEEYGIMVSGV